MGGLQRRGRRRVGGRYKAQFEDGEMFLAEHGAAGGDPADGVCAEDEVAEVLAAATRKDKRKELNKLSTARKFHEAKDVRRSFCVEVEELKKRQCRRCGRTDGRDLQRRLDGAGLVRVDTNFVCLIQPSTVGAVADLAPGMLEQLRPRSPAGSSCWCPALAYSRSWTQAADAASSEPAPCEASGRSGRKLVSPSPRRSRR